MKHYQVHFQPDNKKVSVHHGATLLEAAGLVGIILSNPCGGVGRCGKCAVQLLPSKKEVLACQFTIEHDLEVFIPDSSRFFKQKILEHGISQNILLNPAIEKIFIQDTYSSLDEACNIIAQKLQEPCVIDETLKDGYSKTDHESGVTAVLTRQTDAAGWRLIGLEEGDTTQQLFGFAVDIGTTTIVVRLINLRTSDVVATVSAGNPQAKYGADVISRIGHAETDSGMKDLHQSILSCLNDLFKEAALEAGIETDAVYEVVIAGNTTMNHLLLKYPVRQLGQAPYHAHSLLPTSQNAEKIKLRINRYAIIYTLPNIAGFVGSDTVAAALACGMDTTNAITLLVDIGTNGEIVLGTQEKLLAASCAAGPALEGAGIEFGSRAQAGAIERVVLNDNDIDIDVIGDTNPSTICGSGLIDAVAVMLDLGIFDSTGRFAEPDELSGLMIPKNIKQRIITWHGKPAFVLAGEGEEIVVLTQKDIRQLQLAKAAIQAGILLLLKNSDYEISQIQQVLLAGAFGNYISKENAVRIGLLPNVAMEKIHFVGNAAGSGAQMALISQPARKIAEKLAKTINYLEIAHQTEFQMIFSECLLFPEP